MQGGNTSSRASADTWLQPQPQGFLPQYSNQQCQSARLGFLSLNHVQHGDLCLNHSPAPPL